MSDKKRILFVGEASSLYTGFATYYRELLPRLVSTGKYEIAELGSYARTDDPKVAEFIRGRWKFYGVMPRTQEEQAVFNQPSQHPRDRGQNINQFGAHVFDSVLADFKPDICLPPGNLVMTEDGYRPIEDVHVGDNVLTHTGRFSQVTQTMKNPYNGDVFKVYFHGMKDPLEVTKNHPVLIYRKRKQTNQKKRIDQIYADVEPEFVSVQDVRTGDLVVLPSWNGSGQSIDVTKYLKNYVVQGDRICPVVNGKHSLPAKIDISPSFARLIGYILADGSVSSGNVSITFNETESRFANDVLDICKETLGIIANWHYSSDDKKYIRVDINSSLFAELVNCWLRKRIAKELWLSQADVREQLLAGLIRGDGCYKRNAISFGNCNKRLAYNVRMLYASLQIPCTLTHWETQTAFSPKKIRAFEVNVSTSKYVNRVHSFVQKHDKVMTYTDVFKSASNTNIVNGHMVASIRRIRTYKYNGQVYNLEVAKDNSYVGVCTIHNCVDIRDNWMLNYQLRSPFRSWFKLIWMPTVDAEPQLEEWVHDYEQADLILSYSDYGVNTLKRQSPRMRVLPKAMRPGVDLSTFRSLDRDEVRENFFLRKDLPIIGTVMRNQSRKLYPDLIDAFARMKNLYADESNEVRRAILLIHSAWPDNQFSYDYPRHIMRLQSYNFLPNFRKGIKNDVFQTLMCHNPECGAYTITPAMNLYAKPIEQGRIVLDCIVCGKHSATCPTSGGSGFTREGLAQIYNLMDLYVQCSICEGDGMPIQEAKACGVPSLVMDYTAMREKGRYPAYDHFKKIGINPDNYSCHLGGDVIKVERFYYEPETSCMRALPDIDDMAKKMRDILVDDGKRNKMASEARKAVEENYDWDKLWKQWEFVLDGVKPKDRSETWDSPIVIKNVSFPQSIPEGLDDIKFVEWLYLEVLKYPQVDPVGAQQWTMQLQNGATRDQLFQQFKQIASAGEDGENMRQQIRAAIARQKGEIVIDETDAVEEEWI